MNRSRTVAFVSILLGFLRPQSALAGVLKETIEAAPEPSTLGLVGVGMMCFGLLRLRRHRD